MIQKVIDLKCPFIQESIERQLKNNLSINSNNNFNFLKREVKQ